MEILQTISKRFIIYLSILISSISANGQSVKFKSFDDFIEKIANKHSLTLTKLQMKDSGTVKTKMSRDTMQETFSFRLEDWNIKYVSTRKIASFPEISQSSYILINDKKILPDSDNNFDGLSIVDAYKIILNGTTFLILQSWAPLCNGSFCTIEYDQIFQIKGNEISYLVTDGWQNPSNIYCDLNNDGNLDLISFSGDCGSYSNNSSQSDKDYFFCIQAMTLKNNKFVAIKDKNQKPYYIYLQVHDFYNLYSPKALHYNWMFSLK